VTSFADVLRAQAVARPSDPAFTFLDNGETESDHLTFQELDRDARAIAALLQARTRVGDRALLLYPPGLDFVRAFMGCLYAGVVAVPVDPPPRNPPITRRQGQGPLAGGLAGRGRHLEHVAPGGPPAPRGARGGAYPQTPRGILTPPSSRFAPFE